MYGRNKKNYTIITSDLLSGITLDKQKLRNVNIFEDVNLLEMHLRNTSLGNEIIKKFSDHITLPEGSFEDVGILNEILKKTSKLVKSII